MVRRLTAELLTQESLDQVRWNQGCYTPKGLTFSQSTDVLHHALYYDRSTSATACHFNTASAWTTLAFLDSWMEPFIKEPWSGCRGLLKRVSLHVGLGQLCALHCTCLWMGGLTRWESVVREGSVQCCVWGGWPLISWTIIHKYWYNTVHCTKWVFIPFCRSMFKDANTVSLNRILHKSRGIS